MDTCKIINLNIQNKKPKKEKEKPPPKKRIITESFYPIYWGTVFQVQ
jgi:hypothetical protein